MHWLRPATKRTQALLTAVGIAVLSAPLAAHGQQPVGTLEATAYGALSAATAIRVRRAGTDVESDRVAQLFADELGKRGYRVVDTGQAQALSFRFIAEVEANPAQPLPQVRLRAPDSGATEPGSDIEPILRIDDGRDEVTRLQSSPRTLLVEVQDAERRLLWAARATAAVHVDRREEIAALLVPALLNRLGQTVAAEDIYRRR
jgi:hypothetical protein